MMMTPAPDSVLQLILSRLDKAIDESGLLQKVPPFLIQGILDTSTALARG